MTNNWMLRLVVTIIAVASLSVACKGGGVAPTPPPPPPPVMTQAQADGFVDSLARALAAGMNNCVSRLPVGRLGTFQLNFSCDATRLCGNNGSGGSIRPSITATGQMTVGQNGVSFNMPLAGSQNILDWACATPAIISGNPTVSLAGQENGVFTGNQWRLAFAMTQSGQIIVGTRSCAVNLRTTADENSGNTARTTGRICEQQIDKVTNPL